MFKEVVLKNEKEGAGKKIKEKKRERRGRKTEQEVEKMKELGGS